MAKFDSEMDSVYYLSRNGDNDESKRGLMDSKEGKEFESKDSNGLANDSCGTSRSKEASSRDGRAGGGGGASLGCLGSDDGDGECNVGALGSLDGNDDAATLEKCNPSTGISCGGNEQVIIDHSPKTPSTHSQRRQILAALAANMGAMALGAAMSWSATALPDLRKSGAVGEIDAGQESWVGSLFTLGAAASCPVAGFGIERLGRRLTMLLLTVPFLGGWLLIFLAGDLTMIYVGRFMTGFCSGGFSIAAPVFITETAEANIRGALTSGFDMMLTVGILYIFVVGTFFTWRVQALACGLIPIAFHALMTFVPESPRFLLERGRDGEAAEAIAWLQSSPPHAPHIQAQLSDLRVSVVESGGRAGGWRDVLSGAVLRPTWMGFALMFFQQLSGIDPVMFYTVDIFHSAGSDIDENLSANIVGAIQVGATVTCALVVDKCGRRLLLVLSGIFMMISLFTMGLYFHLKESNDGVSPENLGWLPLLSLMVYVVAFSIGFGPLPWLLLGEIIPSHVKGLAAGLVIVSRWLLGFSVTKLFQDLMGFLGESGGYWFFSFFCFLSIFYVYFCVPETKGKSMDEIQLLFASNPQLEEPQLEDERRKLQN